MPSTVEKLKLAAQMVATPTQQEVRLGMALLESGVRWERQQLVEGWIVDFLSERYWLVLEADGTYHKQPTQWAKDRLRDLGLMRAGYSIIHLDQTAMSREDWAEDLVYGLLVDVLRWIDLYQAPDRLSPISLLLGERQEVMRMSSDVSLSIGEIGRDTLWLNKFQFESVLSAPDFVRATQNPS